MAYDIETVTKLIENQKIVLDTLKSNIADMEIGVATLRERYGRENAQLAIFEYDLKVLQYKEQKKE